MKIKEEQKYKCADCGVESGKNHLENCDIERCPKCNGQLLSCGCDFPKVSSDNKFLIDEKGNRFKRHLVKNSIEEDFDYTNEDEESKKDNKEKIVLAIYKDDRHEKDNIVYYMNPVNTEKFDEIPEGYKVVYDEVKE